MNNRNYEPEGENRSFSDSGELLASLFREAKALKGTRGKPDRRDLGYKSTVKEKSISKKPYDSEENTSKTSSPKAERTAHSGRSAGSTKEKILAKQKSARRSRTLKAGLTFGLLGVLVTIFITHYAPLAFVKGEQAPKAVKKKIIQPSVPKKQPNKAEEKKLGIAIPQRSQKTGATAKEGIQGETPGFPTPIQPSDNTVEVEAVQKERLVSYPYSIRLGSFETVDRARKAVSIFQKKGISPYWVKVDLGPKGVWFRVFTGYFQSRDEAEAFAKDNQIEEGKSRYTKYANLIGTYSSEEELNTMRLKLLELGYYPYVIKGTDGESHLFTGAFYQHARAEKEQSDLASKGIQSQLVER